jgi:superfamily II DNA/RNA helicase
MSKPSFRELGLSAPVVKALERSEINAPFPIQALVIPDALAGRDVLAKAPTGSGKTLAFGVPMVERLDSSGSQPCGLVLVPTRELAAQVAGALAPVAKARGLRVAAVYGGVPVAPQAGRAKGAHILIATPGRLEDLVERRLIKLDAVRILVLDEADRMLDMGFKPQVDRIVRRLPSKRQTMFFSATLDGAVGQMAGAYTNEARVHEANPRTTESPLPVEHHFVPVTVDTKVDKLVELLSDEEGRGLTLVFVRTKRGADRLVRKLERMQVPALAMHGDKTQVARQKALERFESGRVTTLVATDVAARGLDLERITHVINFDPPAEGKDYVHRVGRTGRAGRGGTGITLVLPEQQAEVSRVAANLGHADRFEAEGMTVAPPRVVYTSRRGGRNDRWGRSRPRRKI